MYRTLPALVAACFTALICHAATPSPSTDVSAADNAFGFRLLNVVQKTVPRGNVILSPVSAALNLSMVLNGAAGQTRQEMLRALSLDAGNVEEINKANAQLIKMIRTPANSITLSVADSLWVDKRRATLRPDYAQRMQTSYDAELAELDFSNPNAVQRINAWAADQTHGAIPKVLDRIDPGDLLLLLNAVYFKGQWTHKFDKAQTQQRDFTLEGGSTKRVPRMRQSGRFDYFETPQLQAVRLPFGTGDLVMQIILPAKSFSLGALEAQLTLERWQDWQDQYASRPGALELPRFALKGNYRLNRPLAALGMKRVFDPNGAELTGLLSGPPHANSAHLSISSVLQSTYWKVDEEGAEAAAVTSTGVRTTAVQRPGQPFSMIVDRPFFCAIQDQRSGALLFVAAIYDPEPTK